MEYNQPLVSIITATYKKFDRLIDSINSVIAQDYSNIEYIITDDGSDDFPYSRIKNYLEQNSTSNISWNILRHERNVGTVKNLNDAYKSSKGKYIINLSCGDVFFENDVVSRICKRFADTRCDVLVTSRMVYSGDFQPLYLLPHYEERKIIEKFDSGLKQYRAFISSGFYDMASGSAMSFSRNIMDKIGYYDERYRLWEDGPFLAKFLLQGRLEFAYDIISIWYEGGGISSVNVANAHPQMRQDIDYFTKHEKLSHIDKLTIVEKRRLAYRNKRILKGSRLQQLALYIIYFPEVLYFVHYTKSRKRHEKNDVRIIEQIMREKH